MSGYQKVASNTERVTGNDNLIALNAVCPSTKRVVGGGYLSRLVSGSSSTNLVVMSNGPNATDTAWEVVVRNSNDNAVREVTAYAICANVTTQ